MQSKPKPTVFIVDDDRFMVDILTLMIARMGDFALRGYTDAAAAFAALREAGQAPDLVILDINMPEMDGMEFFRGLAEIGYRGGIVLSSGESDALLRASEQLAASYRLQLLGRIAKPPDFETLKRLVWTCRDDFAPSQKPSRRVPGPDELLDAIAAGEIYCAYQPKVDMRSGALIGVEALARWRHPVDGMIPPGVFSRVAESHNVVTHLTRHVFDVALAQQALWKASGLSLRMSVNASVQDLGDLGFPDFASACIARHRVDANAVVIEVTESGLAHDERILIEVMARLRLRRFHLSIDDFGNGYSTMMKLRDFSFDELKVDHAFVHGAGSNERHAVIFRASADIGKSLGMTIVAEGVEDAADWAFASRNGSDIAQGYFVARPIEAADLPSWHAAWRQRVSSGDIAPLLEPAA
jgi:EAL domain-containing protein (putative c-di-GMP-specific phosphodiesterase class I)